MEGTILLVAGLLLVLGVAAAFAAARANVPMLVVFLGLGMLLGSEGPGGIELGFEDADAVRAIGVIGLVAILFEGGLTTAWRDVRLVVVPAALLSTWASRRPRGSRGSPPTCSSTCRCLQRSCSGQ